MVIQSSTCIPRPPGIPPIECSQKFGVLQYVNYLILIKVENQSPIFRGSVRQFLLGLGNTLRVVSLEPILGGF